MPISLGLKKEKWLPTAKKKEKCLFVQLAVINDEILTGLQQ